MTAGDPAEDQVCAINLEPRGVRTRRIAGSLALAFGGAAAAFLLLLPVRPGWIYFVVAFPYFAGALSHLQAREKT